MNKAPLVNISIIVAAANNGVIGRRNKIPWKMPAELANFKKITVGHPIIMGRKTHQSIGRRLPGRTNIVITRDKSFKTPDGCITCSSLEDALEIARTSPGSDEIFIIGGVNVYEQAMPLAGKLYLTNVHANIPGDKFFRYNPSDWREISRQKYSADENNQYDYDFTILERIKP